MGCRCKPACQSRKVVFSLKIPYTPLAMNPTSTNAGSALLTAIDAVQAGSRAPRKEVSYLREAAHVQQIKSGTDGLRTMKSIESQHRLARQRQESGEPVVLCDTFSQQVCAPAYGQDARQLFH
jgi:hypothetical protein